MFELRLDNNKTIPLKWGTWAMKRFCELENKSLLDLINILSSGSFELGTIVHIIQASAESGCKTLNQPIEFNDVIVCDWIDEVGGLSAKDGQLIEFIKFMQTSMVPETKETAEVTKDKGKKK
jgi:hypothetical protein